GRGGGGGGGGGGRGGAGAGAGRGSARAASAPQTASAAATPRAGRKPSVKDAGVPSPPRAPNTAVPTAMPKTPPKRWSMLFTPEAVPISSGLTASRTAVGTVGRLMEMPTPATARPITMAG